MVRTLMASSIACVLALGTAPAHAAMLTLPFVGDIEHPDMDPFHVVNPEAPAAAAPAPKKHHRMKKRTKKKVM